MPILFNTDAQNDAKQAFLARLGHPDLDEFLLANFADLMKAGYQLAGYGDLSKQGREIVTFAKQGGGAYKWRETTTHGDKRHGFSQWPLIEEAALEEVIHYYCDNVTPKALAAKLAHNSSQSKATNFYDRAYELKSKKHRTVNPGFEAIRAVFELASNQEVPDYTGISHMASSLTYNNFTNKYIELAKHLRENNIDLRAATSQKKLNASATHKIYTHLKNTENITTAPSHATYIGIVCGIIFLAHQEGETRSALEIADQAIEQGLLVSSKKEAHSRINTTAGRNPSGLGC